MNEARELSAKTINEAVGNVSGVATAGGGIMTFLNDNAQGIGAICTMITLLVFLASHLISARYKDIEHRERLKKIQAGQE